MYNRIIAIDLETTGLNPLKDKIIEVGFVVKGRRGLHHRVSHLIAGPKVPKGITKLTGIDTALLNTSGVSLAFAMGDLHRKAYGNGGIPLFVGHNGKAFDAKFLHKAFKRVGIRPIMNSDWWDTMLMTRAHISGYKYFNWRKTQEAGRGCNPGGSGLKDASKLYGVPKPAKGHRALADAVCCMGIFKKQSAKTNFKLG